jgi:hypothetical protein
MDTLALYPHYPTGSNVIGAPDPRILLSTNHLLTGSSPLRSIPNFNPGRTTVTATTPMVPLLVRQAGPMHEFPSDGREQTFPQALM